MICNKVSTKVVTCWLHSYCCHCCARRLYTP
jgi:hypothetical protein